MFPYMQQRPESKTVLVATEMDKYGIDVAALSKIKLSGYDGLADHGYIPSTRLEIQLMKKHS